MMNAELRAAVREQHRIERAAVADDMNAFLTQMVANGTTVEEISRIIKIKVCDDGGIVAL